MNMMMVMIKIIVTIMVVIKLYPVDPGGRALDCSDRRCITRKEYGYTSPMFLVCCVGSGLCNELITRSEESYRLCVSNSA